MTRRGVVVAPASFILDPGGNWLLAWAANNAAARMAAKHRSGARRHLQSANVFGKARTIKT
jgi:hypothetical protein